MNNLLISGNTTEMNEWNIQEVLTTHQYSRKEDRDRMVDYARGQKIGPCCDGMTYLEIEQFDASNNFWKY